MAFHRCWTTNVTFTCPSRLLRKRRRGRADHVRRRSAAEPAPVTPLASLASNAYHRPWTPIPGGLRPMRLFPTAAAALLAASALAAAPAPSPDDTVALKTVKYADLVRTVRDLQGKVVVVDFWGEY